MYRYLSVDIDDLGTNDSKEEKPTVLRCLDNFFRPEEREITCEKCEDGRVATQTLRILSRPKILLLHLKRFVLVEQPIAGNDADAQIEFAFSKKRTAVELTSDLSLAAYSKSESDDSKAKTQATGEKYTLKSVVHHIGKTADSGHYTADALRKDAGGQTS